MKLYHSSTSPFVRKVMVVAKETGLEDQLELHPTIVTPVNPHAELNQDNPLGKVPCLIGDDGQVIFDSRVICEYLDLQHDGVRLIPPFGVPRWRVLRIQALCDGIQEATILTLYERRLRTEDKQFQGWIDAQMAKVHRAMASLATEMSEADQPVDLAAISTAVALAYMDFRVSDLGWQDDYPALAAWFAEFSQRLSMTETVPVDH